MQHTSPPSLYQRWARRLVGFYPASWRERYAEEMLLILEDSAPTLKTILNLLMSLLDAYIHRNMVKERNSYMLQKMRSNELVVYGATLIFFAAWYIAQITSSFRLYVGNDMHYTPSPLLITIMRLVAFSLALCLLLGGLPILLAACWNALRTRNIRTLFFCFVGIMSPLVTVFATLLSQSFFSGTTGTWVALIVCFTGLYISLALIFFGVQRVAPSRRVTHYVLYLATLIPLIMLVGLAGVLFSMLPYLTAALTIGGSEAYIIRHILLILVMVVTFSFTLKSLVRGFQAKLTAQVIPPKEAALM